MAKVKYYDKENSTLGLGEAAAKMIDASVDTIVKEQGENSCEKLLEILKQLKQ